MDALRAEGIELPPECGDVELHVPVDGPLTLHYTELLSGERLAAFGRALARMGEGNIPKNQQEFDITNHTDEDFYSRGH